MRRSRSSGPRPLVGEIRVPGDKSISHRALVFGALAEGRSTVLGPNLGEDVTATAAILEALGTRCVLDRHNGQALVEGSGVTGLREPEGVLDAGNSGTSLRLLLGVCAGVEGLSVLTGDASLRRRPMLRVVAPLRQMGARIDGRAHGDLAPLTVRGGPLEGITIELPVASAQVKSALLLAGAGAAGTTTVIEPGPSRDHTERMLAALGAEVSIAEDGVAIRGGTRWHPLEMTVPGDLSSAMFFVVAAALVPGSDLTIAGVGLNPTRTAALAVLEAMGADLAYEVDETVVGEPVGRIHIRHSPLRGVDVLPAEVPVLIDEVPALAIAAARAEGTTRFTGVGELRVKESDRIDAIATGLRALGSRIEVTRDGFSVTGPTDLTGAEVDSRGDHRIAMAFAIAGLVASSKVRVKGWSSVNTSFPEFLDVLGDATSKR